jgi:hypothetical protein
MLASNSTPGEAVSERLDAGAEQYAPGARSGPTWNGKRGRRPKLEVLFTCATGEKVWVGLCLALLSALAVN